MANEPVLIDTSYWIEYFNRPKSRRARVVRALIEADGAAVNGVILAELLWGARTEKEASALRGALQATAWIQTDEETYARAGELGFSLRRRGVTVPITDCIIAASAEAAGGRILTLDEHLTELATIASLDLVSG